jgi:hypothetical protein
MDPSLFSYLKQAIPGVDDTMLLQGYEQAKQASKANGVDLDSIPPQQVAQAFKSIIGASKNPPPAEAPATAGLDPVAITGKPAVPVPAQGAAAQDALYAGNGPTATRLNTSDPTLQAKAAQELYHKQGGDNQAYRIASDFAAHTRANLGGQAGAVEANAKRWNDLDTARTTGNVAAQQEMAGKGMTAANAVLTTATDTNKSNVELDMKKKAFLIDQRLKGVGADQAEASWDAAKDLYDPNTPSSHAVIAMAKPFLESLGIDSKMLHGLPGMQVQAIITGNQAAFDDWAKKTGLDTNNYNALTGRITANAGAGLAGAQTGQVQLGTKIANTATEGGTKIPSGSNISVGAGPVSITPSPATTGAQAGAATMQNDLRKKVTDYDTNGVGRSIDAVLAKMPNAGILDTGLVGDRLKFIPSEAQALKGGLNAYYTSKGMDPTAAAKAADEIFALTPKNAVKRLAQIKADQLVSNATLKAMEDHTNKNGSLTGFTPPKISTYYNPKTGKVVTSDDPKGDAAGLKSGGYYPITGAQ